MACQEFEEDLSAWLDGELTATEDARVAAHLRTCSDCSKLLQEFQATSLRVRELATPRAPVLVTDAAMRRVRAMPGNRAEPWMERAWRLVCEPLLPRAGFAAVGFAAAVMLAVIVGRHEWVKNVNDNKVIASSEAIRSAAPTEMAEGAPGSSASPTAKPASDPYRLASAPPDAATAEYDFRDPKTHGRRDFGSFDQKERLAWQQGTWHHERRFGRDGWWWVLGRVWYWYGEAANGPPGYASDVRYVNPLPASDPEQPDPAAPSR